MAKIAFSKLGIKKPNEEVKTIIFNENEIEVKQYLPIQEKLRIIGDAISESMDGNKFYNKIKTEMCLELEIIYAYTNITFTDKQKEDTAKLYDMLDSSGLIHQVLNAIPVEELETVLIQGSYLGRDFYNQMNSVYGIMETIATDYANVGTEVDEMATELANPDVIPLLKNVMTRLG